MRKIILEPVEETFEVEPFPVDASNAEEVVRIIKRGLHHDRHLKDDTIEKLVSWCNTMEERIHKLEAPC